MAKRVTASDLIRELAKHARPGLADAQLADVLLDTFVEYNCNIPPSERAAILDLAVARLLQLDWAAPPNAGGDTSERRFDYPDGDDITRPDIPR